VVALHWRICSACSNLLPSRRRVCPETADGTPGPLRAWSSSTPSHPRRCHGSH
jgi:hypothetical protein